MALEGFKRGQALKSELEQLASEFGDRYVADRQRILELLADEFSSFLGGEGFSVSRQGNVIRAMYSGVQLILEIPQATDSFFGCLSVLSLTDSRTPRDKWSLVLLEGKNPSRPRITAKMLPNDEDERMSQQIQELKEKLSTFKPMEFSIMYYRTQDNYRNAGAKEGPIVESITDALTGILEQKT